VPGKEETGTRSQSLRVKRLEDGNRCQALGVQGREEPGAGPLTANDCQWGRPLTANDCHCMAVKCECRLAVTS
jgi:hypothetical protein